MRLLVDIIPFDGGKSGISVYCRNVVSALAAAGHEITLITEPGVAEEFFPAFAAIEAPAWTRRPAISMLWHLFLLPRRLKKLRGKFDGLVIAAANRRVCASYPLPTTATVHDLANFRIPGKYSRSRMFYLAHILPHYAKKAHHLVAVSRATAEDMERFWHVSADATTVLYNGLSPLPERDTSRPSWIEANGLEKKKYLLYVSRIEHPGKNHVALIDAFAALGRKDLTLVLAGGDWKDADKVRAHASSSPAANRIRFTGFLAEEDLREAYENAAAYVFPSKFEGFGLSLLEAMAAGVPCAASNNGALGEIAADVAETFSPDDIEAISAALSRLLGESPEEREARIAKGRVHAATFSWTAHAEGLIKLIAEDTADLFGIRVSSLAYQGVIDKIVAWAKAPRQKPKCVATLNVDFVVNAVPVCGMGGNAELLEFLRRADLVTADGMPIVKLARMKGFASPGRVTGADLVPMLAERFAKESLSFYVLGGSEPALSKALEILREKSPALKIVGTDTSVVPLDDPEAVEGTIRKINAAHPDCLFVAFGNPKQELYAARYAARLEVRVIIGVGGSFNFVAGAVKRAPRWMQATGLEWVWRVISEPRRLWKRYAVGLVKFSILATFEIFTKRKGQEK